VKNSKLIAGVVIGVIFVLIVSIEFQRGLETREVIHLDESDEIYHLPFEEGQGYALIVKEEIPDFIVWVKGLDPNEFYTVQFQRDELGGVTFGPEANVDVRIGTIDGEVLFKPNVNGELYVSMRNAPSMYEGAAELTFYIETEAGKEVLRTIPAKVN